MSHKCDAEDIHKNDISREREREKNSGHSHNLHMHTIYYFRLCQCTSVIKMYCRSHYNKFLGNEKHVNWIKNDWIVEFVLSKVAVIYVWFGFVVCVIVSFLAHRWCFTPLLSPIRFVGISLSLFLSLMHIYSLTFTLTFSQPLSWTLVLSFILLMLGWALSRLSRLSWDNDSTCEQ